MLKIFKFELTKKRIIIIAAAAVLILATVAASVYFSVERYDKNGYNKTKFTATGGGSDDGNANLKKIAYSHGAEDRTDITFTFSSGSGEEQTEMNGDGYLPAYKVEFLASPLRLKVTFEKLAYWDYIISGAPVDETELVLGSFRCSSQEDTVLYFNLSSDVLFNVSENANTLTVSLKKSEKTDSEASWYLICDLYYEYQEGTVTESSFTPVLSSDKITVIMISEPFKSRDEAEKERQRLLTGDFEGQDIRIVELDRFTLPRYSDKTDTFALLNESILSVNGAKTKLPLFFADARFLCWLPDNSGALFAKSEDSGEILYVADKTGTKRQLLSKSFATVIKASFANDCNTLAFIEQAEDTALITVADLKTGEVSVLGGARGAELFGSTVISIALNADGTKIYCLSGDGIYSLKEYDVATREISLIATSIVTESEIYFHDGYLYYCDVIDEYECIVRISTEDGRRQMLARGSQFALAPNGDFIAVLTEDYETAVSDLRMVKVNNEPEGEAPEDGTDTEKAREISETVIKDITTGEFFISADSRSIYYITETGDGEFYYQILRYSVDTKETSVMAQAVNGVFFPSNVADEIIISVIYSSNDGITHPVTYIANFLSFNTQTNEE